MTNLFWMYLNSALIKKKHLRILSQEGENKEAPDKPSGLELGEEQGTCAADSASPYFGGLALNEQVNVELEKQDTYFQ